MKTYNTKFLYRQLILLGRQVILMTLMTAILIFFLSTCTNAQQLDVPYVSTPHNVVEKMLNVAQVGNDDYVIDLGCGDGRIVIAAAQRGAFGHGLDLDPNRIREAETNARQTGVDDRVMFLKQDIFNADFSRANVITMYLLRSVNLKLRPVLLDSLEPGTKIVSHNFDMGDWKPDKRIRVDHKGLTEGKNYSVKTDDRDFFPENWVINPPREIDSSGFDLSEWMAENPLKLKKLDVELEEHKLQEPLGINVHTIYYWVVPANVEGQWQWQSNGKRFTMKATQKFQEIRLTVLADNIELQIEHSGLTGKRIAFTAVNPATETRYVYNGSVEGGQIKGKVQIRNNDKSIENWSARRE